MGFFGIFKRNKAKNDYFLDSDRSEEANKKAQVIHELKHQARALEYEAKVLREQKRVDQLKAEIAFYKNPPQEEAPQHNQMQELMQLFLMFQAFNGKSGENGGDMAQFMASLQDPNILNSPASSGNLNKSTIPQNINDIPLSDEAIRENLSLLPPDKVKLAKKLNPGIIKSYIKKNFDYSDATIERAIQIIKTEM